jgi:hypothetical protein
MDTLGTRWGGSALGTEPINALLPDEKARYRPQRGFVL